MTHLGLVTVAAIFMTSAISCVARDEGTVAPHYYEFTDEKEGPLSTLFKQEIAPSASIQISPYHALDESYLLTVGITEISMERTACYGNCPQYYVAYRADGSAVYDGYKNTKRLGRHCAKIHLETFGALVRVLQDIGYFEMLSHYSQMTTDAPSTYLSVVRNGRRKIVEDYAGAGPGRLIAFGGLMDSTQSVLEWVPCSE